MKPGWEVGLVLPSIGCILLSGQDLNIVLKFRG